MQEQLKEVKILVLSFYYEPDLSAGSFRSSALVKSLLSRLGSEDEIEIITTLPNRYSSYSSEAAEFEKKGRVSIHRVRLPAHQNGMLDQSRSFLSFARYVSKRTKNQPYDLVYATSSRLMTAVLGCFVAKRSSICLYLDIRDIFVDTMKDVLSKKVVAACLPFFGILERWAIGGAQRVNLVSRGFQDYFETRYPSQTFDFYSNGIDSIFLEKKESYEPSSDREGKKVSILYAGNFGEGQGLHKIIPQLASLLSDRVSFRLLGDGGRKSKLEEKVASLECKNVTILGPVTRDELLAEYQDADVLFIHLNDHDAFKKVLPSKLFEYAATGKPILAGVSGYASSFLEAEVVNAKVFRPCDAESGLEAFNSLALRHTHRQSFIEKYSRVNIMSEMTGSLLDLLQEDVM